MVVTGANFTLGEYNYLCLAEEGRPRTFSYSDPFWVSKAFSLTTAASGLSVNMGDTVEVTWAWGDDSLATDLDVYLCRGASMATDVECSASSECAHVNDGPVEAGTTSYTVETAWGTTDTDFVYGNFEAAGAMTVMAAEAAP